MRYPAFLLLINLLRAPLWADTHAAASCEQSAVNAAVTASEDGDTVTIPACSDTAWASSVVITKAITIQGAGVDVTNLVMANTNHIMRLAPGTGAFHSRMTGITFKGSSSAGGANGVVVLWTPTNTSYTVRFDHCKITSNTNLPTVLSILGTSRVLVDHVTFENTAVGNPELIHFMGDSTGVIDSPTWKLDSSIATANNVFVEDCTFTNQYAKSGSVFAFQMYYAARVVFRYNTIVNMGIDCHGFVGPYHGGRSWEIYNNTITLENGYDIALFVMRGGTGVIHHNDITTWKNVNIQLIDYGCTGLAPNACCIGYPTADQIGRGKLTGTFPSSGACTAPRSWSEESEPAYIWSNTATGGTLTVYVPDNTGCSPTQNLRDFIVENTDYFLSEKAGYSAYAYPHPLQGTSNCDINEDGYVNATDVTAEVNVIQGRTSSTKGDLNSDGIKDIFDLMILIGVVYLGAACP